MCQSDGVSGYVCVAFCDAEPPYCHNGGTCAFNAKSGNYVCACPELPHMTGARCEIGEWLVRPVSQPIRRKHQGRGEGGPVGGRPEPERGWVASCQVHPSS